MATYECIFAFYNKQGRRGRCWLRLYAREQAMVAVAGEAPGNEGATVGAAIEAVATAVVDRFNLNPHRLTMVAHFPPDSVWWRRGEYNRVTMTWVVDHYAYPQWQNLSAQDVQGLTGEPIARGTPFWASPREGWVRCLVGKREAVVSPLADSEWQAVVQSHDGTSVVERGFPTQVLAQGWALDELARLAAEHDVNALN